MIIHPDDFNKNEISAKIVNQIYLIYDTCNVIIICYY